MKSIEGEDNKQNNCPVPVDCQNLGITLDLFQEKPSCSASPCSATDSESQPQTWSFGYFSPQDSQGFSYLWGWGQHY